MFNSGWTYHVILKSISCNKYETFQIIAKHKQNIIMNWVTIPELIFCDIMMKVGLDSIETLHRCRQVCKTWNETILEEIWGNQSRKRMMKMRIEEIWDCSWMFPSDDVISHAKWLGR